MGVFTRSPPNTAVILPAIALGLPVYMLDPKLSLSVGIVHGSHA